jgi:hypothetical protein
MRAVQTAVVFRSVFVLSLATLIPAVAFADSPVTSTDFHRAYPDSEHVRAANDEKTLTADLAELLARGDIALDEKAAIINALGWESGTTHVEAFKRHLTSRYDPKRAERGIDLLSGEEAFVLGYLMLLGDYFHPEEALPHLAYARARLPKSFTVAVVHALAEAQADMDKNWCKVWRRAEGVLDDRKLVRDMRPAAVEIIREYMALYQDSCTSS